MVFKYGGRGVFSRFGRKVISFGLLLAIASQALAKDHTKFVEKLFEVLPNVEMAIEKERGKDGLIYLAFYNVGEDNIHAMIENPDVVKLKFDEGDKAYNTLGGFMDDYKGQRKIIAVEIDIFHRKITRVFDSDGKQLYEIKSKQISVSKEELKDHLGAYIRSGMFDVPIGEEGKYYVYSSEEVADFYRKANRGLMEDVVQLNKKTLREAIYGIEDRERHKSIGKAFYKQGDVEDYDFKRFGALHIPKKEIFLNVGKYLIVDELGNVVHSFSNRHECLGFPKKKDAEKFKARLQKYLSHKYRVVKISQKGLKDLRFYK